MSLSVKMDVVKYRHDMNQFVTRLNADGVQLLKEEMRLLLRDILRFTPPTKGLTQGRRAVEGDLRRNAKPLDWKNIKIPRLAEAVFKKDVATINAITKNMKGGEFSGRTLLRNLAAIRNAHLSNRTSHGRVRSDKRNMAFLPDWNKYLRSVQSRVGWHKAGWFRAAQAVGLQLPSWVNRHRGKVNSAYHEPSPQALSITAINRSVKIPNYQERHVIPAVRARFRSLASELRRLVAGGKTRRRSLGGDAAPISTGGLSEAAQRALTYE